MTHRRRTSEKRSAARSSTKRLEPAIFYLGEPIYSRILGGELERMVPSIRQAKNANTPFARGIEQRDFQ
jgi:hypothetical protein